LTADFADLFGVKEKAPEFFIVPWRVPDFLAEEIQIREIRG